MGFNITGLVIDKTFNNDPHQLADALLLPIEWDKEITFEEASTSIKDENTIDIYFAEKGTFIFFSEPMEVGPTLSKNCSILNYVISETAMLFIFELYKNEEKIRGIVKQEDQVLDDTGNALNIENQEKDVIEMIFSQMGLLTGQQFNQIPLDATCFRYKKKNIKKEEKYTAPFYDSNTLASNPGKINLNVLQWIKMNFSAVLKRTIFLIIGLYAMLKWHWIFGIFFIGALFYNVWYWFTIINKFKAGDMNPGKVISINPDKIAVATNMSKFGGQYPILRIVETNLNKEEKLLNTFIPTIALYNNNPHDYPFWAEFHPVPVSHGVSNKEQIKNILHSFSKTDLKIIDNYWAQLKNTTEVGTYKINIDSSSWKDYRDVELGDVLKMKKPNS